ncbi:MAG: gluconokinase [Deinococcales bacterium]
MVMGVSGSGKTTVGKRLASRLGFAFADADSYHPQANIDKMAAGVPLTDEDRQPWLERLRALIEKHAAEGRSLVLACSALKESYRRELKRAQPAARVQFVYLEGDFDTILARIRRRKGHYMKANMLQSQFRDLEEPEDAITVDVDRLGVPGSVRRALAGLASRGVHPGGTGHAPVRQGRGGGSETP